MNTILETRTDHSHSPHLRRETLLDRIALHGGLALIAWAQRTDQATRTVGFGRAQLPARQAREVHQARIAHRELTEARYRIGLIG